MAADRLIPLGRIVNVHATRGELRLLPFNPDTDTLEPGMTVVLRRGETIETRELLDLRRHKQFLLIILQGCNSMNDAEKLVGYEVCVHEAELPPIGPNEIYHYQLIGMEVVTDSGETLGTVHEVMTPPSSDVCVVRGGGREYLIPLIAQVVLDVDVAARRMTIHPLPGLLDE